MAVVAGEIRVRAGQRKPGLPIVIKLPRTPARRIVAVVALIAEAAAMRVFVDVTRHARTAGIVVSRRCMALLAGQVRVGPEQRKTRDIVIEPYACGPARRDMTARAATPELTRVHIVRGMARTTIAR